MGRRRTIGKSPLDTVIPGRERIAEVEAPKGERKLRYTFHLPIGLVERVRDAVYWQPDLTLASFAERSLEEGLKKLQMERNKGEPFPVRKGELKGGRPIAV